MVNIPAYNLHRAIGWPAVHPFNLTISVTGRCNSKCKTCNMWKEKPKDLSPKDWKAMLGSVGSGVQWVTVTGGEPFLRKDLRKLLVCISESLKPKIITIPTNGILTKKILMDVIYFKEKFSGHLIVNVSIDGDEKEHDCIRGVKCYKEAVKTVRQLKEMGVTTGMHTVISKYNSEHFTEILDLAEEIKPDSFICQVAEERAELKTVGVDLTPKDYSEIMDMLLTRKVMEQGISKTTQRLRRRYYKLTRDNITLPCFAGIASAHVNYNGDVWACCVKCQKMGNLLDLDFKTIWKGARAKKIRTEIKEGCSCQMANAYYTNLICRGFL